MNRKAELKELIKRKESQIECANLNLARLKSELKNEASAVNWQQDENGWFFEKDGVRCIILKGPECFTSNLGSGRPTYVFLAYIDEGSDFHRGHGVWGDLVHAKSEAEDWYTDCLADQK